MAYDLASIDASGDLTRPERPITGAEYVVQRIRLRLGTYRGEWPLDTGAGIDWIDRFQRTLDLDEITQAVLTEVQSTPGVESASVDRRTYSASTRAVSLTLRVRLLDEADPIVLGLQALGPRGNGVPWATLIVTT